MCASFAFNSIIKWVIFICDCLRQTAMHSQLPFIYSRGRSSFIRITFFLFHRLKQKKSTKLCLGSLNLYANAIELDTDANSLQTNILSVSSCLVPFSVVDLNRYSTQYRPISVGWNRQRQTLSNKVDSMRCINPFVRLFWRTFFYSFK